MIEIVVMVNAEILALFSIWPIVWNIFYQLNHYKSSFFIIKEIILYIKNFANTV